MILVTGATGHIGNVVVRELIQRGMRVRALVLPGEDSTPLDGLDVEQFEGDILDPECLCQAMQSVEIVYHLAGMISIVPGQQDDLVRRVNIQGTLNVLKTARECGIKRLVYTSSIHAIRRAADGVTIDETLSFDPENPYGEYDRSKAKATLAVLDAARSGLDVVIACPTGVIGPFDFRKSEMGSLICDWMQPKIQFVVDGHYDFVDVRDVAQGLILICERGRTGEAYILSGERIALARILDEVQFSSGVHSARIRVPIWLARLAARLSPLFCRIFKLRPRLTSYSLETVLGNSNISRIKAQKELGYHPRRLGESIADTVRWWRQAAAFTK